MAERQFGPYRLVRQIAVGGMAEIHLAKTKGIAGFEKYVALKMIHPNYAADEQFIQMLVDEAKIAVQLNHGNIAQTFDLGRVGDTYYITMEYVDGADLYKILRRGSEMDAEVPLDVAAFVAKEIASALDHAHRKRDHNGKTLGIVHRDVSPQNVLISYSGEVKLVDFGIAKATMKAKHTAVGVIKGKYYYMSPEQAWGDQIDYRSDIFSAGIVLYEMITGQMLYLEEDLQRLLDMVRKADIAPPSTLRRGVPPQLERIVMHALAKDRRDRYQSASDFATDLERFLHSYSPVFTRTKVSAFIKDVLGAPAEPPEEVAVEERDGPNSTHTLTSDDLIQDKGELERDENSVIFRVADLKPKRPTESVPVQRPKQPTGGVPSGPRVTRQADISDIAPPKSTKGTLPPMNKPGAKPAPQTAKPALRPSRPRDANEVTREVPPMRPPPSEDSGLLGLDGPGPAPTAVAWKKQDSHGTQPGAHDLDGIGDSTMIGGPSFGGGLVVDHNSDDGSDATQISQQPLAPDLDTNPGVEGFDGGGTFAGETHDDVGGQLGSRDDDTEDTDGGEDGPTIQRDFREAKKPKQTPVRAAAPPALSANIHAPAVSELRKPRASRKTPAAGMPAQVNVLQQIVAKQPSEAMPTPRPGALRNDDSNQVTLPEHRALGAAPDPNARGPMQQRTLLGQESPFARTGAPSQPPATQTPSRGLPSRPPTNSPTHGSGQQPIVQPPSPQSYTGYATDASGLPLQTPPQGSPVAPNYPYQQGYPPPGPYPGYPPQGYPGYPAPPVSPGALYQLQPMGAPPPQPMSLTGQMRLFEADELGDKYKLQTGAPRWLKMALASVIAVAVAAGMTFFIIKATRDSAPKVATVKIDSTPAGAEVVFDDVRMAGATPLTIPSVPTGTRHEVRVELARHKAYTETIDIPAKGGEVTVSATLEGLKGKLRVVTHPDGAQIFLDGVAKGVAPSTIDNVDMQTARKLELRLPGYATAAMSLEWSDKGYIDIDQKLTKN